MVKFNVTDAQADQIVAVVDRVQAEIGTGRDRQSIAMDLSATIAQGCDLDLEKLLAFDAFNFAHDIYGIERCLDRSTGMLTNHFLPRCAR